MAENQGKDPIVSAAIKFTLAGGKSHIFTGYRHLQINDVFATERIRNGWKVIEKTEGFLTRSGQFVDRTQAMAIAKACGQLKHDTDRAQLNSEDLW